MAEGGGRSAAATDAITTMTGEMEIAMEKNATKDVTTNVKREVWSKYVYIFIMYNTEIY